MAVDLLDDDQREPPRHTDNPVDYPPPQQPADPWQQSSNGGGGSVNGGYALPSGVSQDQADDFIRRNPGDYARLASAFQPTGHRESDSQGPMYDQATNALRVQPPQLAGLQNPSFASAGPSGGFGGYGLPGSQFSNDPYSKLLEQMAQSQLAFLQQPQANPAMDKLLAFLDTRFTDLSSAPGYSPEELALLRTQALDPIERDRTASQRRSLDRTAARGMLSSSGLAELDSREVDFNYDQLRGAAQRDLGVNAIARRDQDLAQALGIGQLAGVAIPGLKRSEDVQRRGEQLNLGSLLYNMPRQALHDSLAVVNGSPAPGDNFSQAAQLMEQRQQQQYRNDQQNAAFWGQLGETFAGLFGG